LFMDLCVLRQNIIVKGYGRENYSPVVAKKQREWEEEIWDKPHPQWSISSSQASPPKSAINSSVDWSINEVRALMIQSLLKNPSAGSTHKSFGRTFHIQTITAPNSHCLLILISWMLMRNFVS
jgi:hypothetical protein